MPTFVALVMNQNRTYTLLVLIVSLAIGIKAQEIDGPYLVFKLLKQNSITYHPNTYQTNKVILDSTEHGAFVLSGSKYDPMVSYTPDTAFVGKDTATYEYKDFYGKYKYLSFIFEVTKSSMVLRPDVYLVDMNSSDTDVTPLANDSSSLGSPSYLHISNVSASNNLIASKINNSTIRFRPVNDFTGVAYVNYTVCDTYELCKDATLVVNVVDLANLASDTLHRGTPKATPVSIPLPQGGYSTHDAPQHGTLEFNTDYSVLYKPASSFSGKDTFIVVSNGIYRSVFMEVYPVKAQNKIVVNDYFFLPKDSTINFNVGNNDIVKKYAFLLDQGPSRGTLTALDNLGNFSYEPESGYEGMQDFTYKVCPQGNCEYGTVKLFVGNWEPDNRTTYKFSTPKNVPLVFSYHIPIDAYNFSSPDDSVRFYPGFDTVYLDYKGCKDTVIGYNLLIFHTPKDYAGLRNFTVEYCIASTNECIEAICEVDIYDESKNCAKHCAGDCVWPGDVNLDGEVTMLDLLQVAYHLGAEGSSRTYQSTSNFRALRANDWDENLNNGFANLKHADTDGNGEININDSLYISNFYRKQHSLVPKPVYDRGEFPFNLNVLTPNADIGDLAMIEVELGDETYPAINLSGYSYELDYNVDVVDENTLEVGFYDNGWAAQNASLLHMYKKPWAGRLESGFGRSNGKKVSGRGGVELITFIVEDDIGGFRREKEGFRIPFYFQNIHAINEDGKLIQLKDQTAYIHLTRKDSRVLDPQDLIVYPVPAGEFLTLHLNGKNKLTSLALYTLSGHLIKAIQNPNAKHNQIELDGIQNGLYLLKAETTLGPISKKVEIIR